MIIEHRLGALKLLQQQGVFANSIEHVFDAGLECANTGTGGLSGQKTVAGLRSEAEDMHTYREAIKRKAGSSSNN